MKPHKHAAAIIAWAQGQSIEFRVTPDEGWQPITAAPTWYNDYEYRAAPANAVAFIAITRTTGGAGPYFEPPEGSREVALAEASDPGLTVKALLRIKFDPDTLNLISASVEHLEQK